MSRKIMKKRSLFMLLGIILVLILLGCSFYLSFTKDEEAVADGTQMELVVSAIPSVAPRLREDADAFMDQYPHVEIKINEYEETAYKEQAPALFLSTEKPDVAWYWNERWYHDIVKSGALVPLDDLYEKEEWNQVLNKSTLERYTSPDGHKYSVNINIVWTPVIYYNKQAFLEAEVKVPENFDDLFSMATPLKKANYIPLVAGLGEPHVAGHLFDAVLQRSVQPQLFTLLLDRRKEYTEINYTSKDLIETWSVMRRMAEELMPENPTIIREEEARALFVQGKSAMYSSVSVHGGLIEREMPEDFEVGFFYYPQLKKDIPPKVQLYTGDALMAIQGTGKETLAKEFIAFVMSYERQKRLAAQMIFPARTDLNNEDLREYGPLFTSMYRQMNDLGTTPLWDDDIPGEMANTSFDLHQAVMASQMEPVEAGNILQETFEKNLQDYKN